MVGIPSEDIKVGLYDAGVHMMSASNIDHAAIKDTAYGEGSVVQHAAQTAVHTWQLSLDFEKVMRKILTSEPSGAMELIMWVKHGTENGEPKYMLVDRHEIAIPEFSQKVDFKPHKVCWHQSGGKADATPAHSDDANDACTEISDLEAFKAGITANYQLPSYLTLSGTDQWFQDWAQVKHDHEASGAIAGKIDMKMTMTGDEVVPVTVWRFKELSSSGPQCRLSTSGHKCFKNDPNSDCVKFEAPPHGTRRVLRKPGR